MGAVKHTVRFANDHGFEVPVRRQPPLVVGYEHFRLDRQGQLLSPKTLIYYDDTVLPFLRWLEAEGVRRFDDLVFGHRDGRAGGASDGGQDLARPHGDRDRGSFGDQDLNGLNPPHSRGDLYH